MKSQDLLLLLKLVALERRASELPPQSEEATAMIADFIGSANAQSTGEPRFQLDMTLDPYSVRGLAASTGISKSEVSNALSRCYVNGLARPPHASDRVSVNRRGLEEFLSYGVRYVFPAQTLGLARGIPTGLTAPIFEGILRSAGEQSPVWPDPHGTTLGVAVEPLYKSVPSAIRDDETLYKLLAAVDSIRLGQPRERKLTITQLQQLLDY